MAGMWDTFAADNNCSYSAGGVVLKSEHLTQRLLIELALP